MMPGTVEQRMGALQQANDIRGARARLKKRIALEGVARGRRIVANLIEGPDWWHLTMTPRALIAATRQGGRRLLGRVTRATGVDLDRRIGDIPIADRAEVAAALRLAATEYESRRGVAA